MGKTVLTDVVGYEARSARLLGGGLNEACLSVLLDRCCRTIHVGKGEVLLRADDDRAVMIRTGAVKAHATTRDGSEVITAILGPGDTSSMLVALGHAAMGTQLTALLPTEGLLMLGSELRQLLPGHPAITSACLRTVARQQASAYDERLRFAGTSVSERVAVRVLTLAERWGEADGRRVRITLPLSQEELAAWSGASRESVAKVLHLMRATQLIATERCSLTVLDIDRLRRRCDVLEVDAHRSPLGLTA